jgi:flavodoxin
VQAVETSKLLSRREALKNACLLGVTANVAFSPNFAEAQQSQGNVKVLVAYFSRTGNTRLVAHQVRRALGADLFEMQPGEPYPEDSEATVKQAEKERDSGYEPPLRERVPRIEAYQTVFLGFPIWGMSAPPVIRSFLSGHDLSGKTLVPLITHGGYGLGQSLAVVARYAPSARLLKGLSMQADQERETLSRVISWLGRLPIAKQG